MTTTRPKGRPQGAGIIATQAAAQGVTAHQLITSALKQTGANVTAAARLLGVHRRTLQDWIIRLNITIKVKVS